MKMKDEKIKCFIRDLLGQPQDRREQISHRSAQIRRSQQAISIPANDFKRVSEKRAHKPEGAEAYQTLRKIDGEFS